MYNPGAGDVVVEGAALGVDKDNQVAKAVEHECALRNQASNKAECCAHPAHGLTVCDFDMNLHEHFAGGSRLDGRKRDKVNGLCHTPDNQEQVRAGNVNHLVLQPCCLLVIIRVPVESNNHKILCPANLAGFQDILLRCREQYLWLYLLIVR